MSAHPAVVQVTDDPIGALSRSLDQQPGEVHIVTPAAPGTRTAGVPQVATGGVRGGLEPALGKDFLRDELHYAAVHDPRLPR